MIEGIKGFQFVRCLGIAGRNLQSSNDNSSGTTPTPSSNDAYEFVAFLLWYIFLVLCCVIPTCCAYRRRRILEQRIALHQSTLRQSNNLFILSNLQQNQQLRQLNSEHVQHERLAILREELKGTTMTIQEENIEKSVAPSATPNDETILDSMESGEASNGSEKLDDTDLQLVRLPADGVHIVRTVPGICTICLCAYEDGDKISWSTEESCQHAFHTDCIIPWLAKKEEPRCPVCRQVFCPAANVPDEAFNVDLDRENSFLQSFSHALALSQFYRPFSAETANNYDQTRNAITLQLANLALETQAAENPTRSGESLRPTSIELAVVPQNGGDRTDIIESNIERINRTSAETSDLTLIESTATNVSNANDIRQTP